MPTESRLWDALGTVSDPEYPLSIVDLGMVYAVREEHGRACVTMTFTSIGCPAIDMIVADVRAALRQVPGVQETQVEIVWDPPWTRHRISDRGRRVLAVYGVAC